MEYTLLKKIERPLACFIPREADLRNPYPSVDFVNPGVGSICKNYSIYVPLYANHLPHGITKVSNHQIGAGASNTEPSKVPISRQLPSSTFGRGGAFISETDKPEAPLSQNLSSEDVTSANDKKRKLLGDDDIFNAFMHPKIKTSKVNFGDISDSATGKASALADRVKQKQPTQSKYKFKLH